jgi:hypothetical protein
LEEGKKGFILGRRFGLTKKRVFVNIKISYIDIISNAFMNYDELKSGGRFRNKTDERKTLIIFY